MIKLMLPKTRAHVKGYEGQTKWTYFLIEHDDLLEKCNIIWDKISANIKKEFDSKLVYKKKSKPKHASPLWCYRFSWQRNSYGGF